MERISSNSQTLKEKFPEVYREFFSRCHTVVSIPAYFLWTGNLLSYYGGLCVMNKLPLRMYIGLSESKHNEIVVNSSYQCYSRSQQFFSNLQTDDNLIKSVNIVSNNHEKYKNLFSKKCSIQFLAEHPIGSSLFAPSLSTAGVGFALLFYNNKISLDQVNQWPSKTFEELKHNHKLGFHEIFLNIWNFVEAVRDSYSSGVSIFNALVSSSYPIVYFSENKNWYAWRLNELAALPKIPFWPIDFGIIHTGIISQSRAVVTDCKNHPAGIYYITDATNMIRKDIKNRLPNHSSLTKRMIKSKESFWSTYIQMFNALSLTNFHSLINLLSHYVGKDEFRLFFSSLNQYQHLYNFLGLGHEIVNALSSEIHRRTNKFGDEIGAGVKSTGVTSNEILFAVTRTSSFVNEINEIINSLVERFGPDIVLDYASWLDGYETEGIKIEQSLKHGIYSEFISRDAVKVQAYTSASSSSPQIFLLSPEEFEREKSKVDLLLDEKKNKIYLRGREMSSNELHSSKFTIAVLKILLANPGREIKNRQLPDLSYRSNRYDLQGKIIDPLKHALTKWTDKNFNLKISGGITNFSIKFLSGNLTIWFIKK